MTASTNYVNDMTLLLLIKIVSILQFLFLKQLKFKFTTVTKYHKKMSDNENESNKRELEQA